MPRVKIIFAGLKTWNLTLCFGTDGDGIYCERIEGEQELICQKHPKDAPRSSHSVFSTSTERINREVVSFLTHPSIFENIVLSFLTEREISSDISLFYLPFMYNRVNK